MISLYTFDPFIQAGNRQMFHLFHKFPRALDGRGESGELRFFFGAGRAARAALTAASVAAAGQLPCRSVSMHLEKDQDHHGCDAQDQQDIDPVMREPAQHAFPPI